METNEDFPILSFLASALSFVAAILFLGGLFYGIIYLGAIEGDKSGYLFGGGAILIGLFLEVIAEIIGVIFAIEKNTRQTKDAIKDYVFELKYPSSSAKTKTEEEEETQDLGIRDNLDF